jgi:chemotaxis protein MotB
MKILHLIVITALLMSFSACVSKSKYTDLEGDLSATQQQLEAKNKEIQELEETRKMRENQIDEMEKQLQDKQARLQDMDAQLQALDDALQIRDKELMLRSKELQEKDKELREKEMVIDEMASTRKSIEAGLKDQIASKQVKLETLEGKLKITFVDKILFNSGSAQINQAGQQTLLSLADTLRQAPEQKIVVEGHTDNVGLGQVLQKVFPTNWELSTARATSVVRFLQDKAEIQPTRLSATGFSFYKPVAENETDEGRAQNRRIEIILVPPR